MPDYIQYDKEGKIINRWMSVDPSVVLGKPNVIEVSRTTLTNLTEFSVVKDGKVAEMSTLEKTALASAKQATTDANLAKLQTMKDELKKLGLSDATINYLIDPR